MCIVTQDELGDAQGLKLHTKINGETKQDSSTSNMMFNVQHIIAHLSEAFTLEPGDVIITGTPSGVGFVRDPPEFLEPGDKIEQYIEKIGYLHNSVVKSK